MHLFFETRRRIEFSKTFGEKSWECGREEIAVLHAIFARERTGLKPKRVEIQTES